MDWDASDFERVCDEFAVDLVRKRPNATRLAAEFIKGLSQSKTPVESGDLRGSHDVRMRGFGAEVYVPGPYARYQHYGLDFRHEVGQALYLEAALLEGAEAAFAIMGGALR